MSDIFQGQDDRNWQSESLRSPVQFISVPALVAFFPRPNLSLPLRLPGSECPSLCFFLSMCLSSSPVHKCPSPSCFLLCVMVCPDLSCHLTCPPSLLLWSLLCEKCFRTSVVHRTTVVHMASFLVWVLFSSSHPTSHFAFPMFPDSRLTFKTACAMAS